jgi:GMP synthase (glutamine-hydrolysing)
MTLLIVNSAEWGEDHARADYPKDVGQWFVAGIGQPARECAVWRVQIEAEPPVTDPAAVYLSGSSASAYETDEWIGRLSGAIQRWAEREIPMLGVCFGHQIVAGALGGKVVRNPKGWEVGVQDVDLTEEGMLDPLFRGFPRRFPVMQSHQDVVTKLPAGARVLAGNEMSAYQSFALGDRIRTVQFHPEYTPEHLRFLLTPRRQGLEATGVDMDATLGGIRATPESGTILRRFLDEFVK